MNPPGRYVGGRMYVQGWTVLRADCSSLPKNVNHVTSTIVTSQQLVATNPCTLALHMRSSQHDALTQALNLIPRCPSRETKEKVR